MRERLTKEREAEIRQQVERWLSVPFTSPTVEEWCHMANAAHDWPGDDPRSDEDRDDISREIEDESLDGLRAMLCDALRLATKHRAELLDELDALRAAPPTTYQHADGTEEPIGELVARLTRERDEAIAKRDATAAVLMRQAERAEAAEARVRELEADQAQAAQAVVDAQACEMAFKERAEKAEADLAETRAQLARLREAATHFERGLSRFCDGPEREALRAALSTPGPTLASVRAESLRAEADREDEADGSGYLIGWLRQRAADLEAGRG